IVAVLVFLIFLAAIYRRLRNAEGEDGVWSLVVLVTGIVFVAMVMGGTVLLASVAGAIKFGSTPEPSPEIARFLPQAGFGFLLLCDADPLGRLHHQPLALVAAKSLATRLADIVRDCVALAHRSGVVPVGHKRPVRARDICDPFLLFRRRCFRTALSAEQSVQKAHLAAPFSSPAALPCPEGLLALPGNVAGWRAHTLCPRRKFV